MVPYKRSALPMGLNREVIQDRYRENIKHKTPH